jgi:hypothetical protein
VSYKPVHQRRSLSRSGMPSSPSGFRRSAISSRPGVDISLNLPATLHQAIALLAFLFTLAIPLVFTWVVARGVRRGLGWARIVLLSVFMLFLPFRLLWLVSHRGTNLESCEALAHLALDCFVMASPGVGEVGSRASDRPCKLASEGCFPPYLRFGSGAVLVGSVRIDLSLSDASTWRAGKHEPHLKKLAC